MDPKDRIEQHKRNLEDIQNKLKDLKNSLLPRKEPEGDEETAEKETAQ